MTRILLEGAIIIMFVLIGISVFVPSDSRVQDVIVEFESAVQSGEIVNDGEIKNVEVSVDENTNFFSNLNCKIANTIVNGINSIFDLGIRILRKIIN